MRILFLNYEFPPIGGGGANATSYLFREFARIPEVSIDCVTSAWRSGDCEEPFATNIRLFRLDVGKRELHYWTQREVLIWLLRGNQEVKRLMSQNKYDVCHAFFGFPSGMVSWLQRKKMPYLVSLRGSDVPGFNPRFTTQYLLLKPLFRKIWSASGAVVANSEGLQRLARSFMPELNIDVVPNGINTAEFTVENSLERTPGKILCVSRLVERKGVQDLVAAMPGILANAPHAHLVIVGEGDLLETLKSRCRELAIADKVDFRGYVAHKDLPQIYNSAELFVQPSFYEGMSNTVLEAMSCGLPIIATGEGGREELLRENALMSPYGDSSAMAEEVAGLFSNPQKMTMMGQTSRNIANHYSWSAVAQSYLDIYTSLSKSRLASRVSRPEV